MNQQQPDQSPPSRQVTFKLERTLEAKFQKLPPDCKVLVALFAAVNSASGVAGTLDLPNRLWSIVRFGDHGPLAGQSEEVNWLKGICDGIFLVVDHT